MKATIDQHHQVVRWSFVRRHLSTLDTLWTLIPLGMVGPLGGARQRASWRAMRPSKCGSSSIFRAQFGQGLGVSSGPQHRTTLRAGCVEEDVTYCRGVQRWTGSPSVPRNAAISAGVGAASQSPGIVHITAPHAFARASFSLALHPWTSPLR